MRRTGGAPVLLAVCLALATLAQAEPDLAGLVRQLGDAQFAAREQAAAALREAGDTAIPFLEAAEHAADPELRLRARELLAELRLGITPRWPAELVALAKGYPHQDEPTRLQTLDRFQALGAEAVGFYLMRLAAGPDTEAAKSLDCLRGLTSDGIAERVVARLREPNTSAQRRAVAWAQDRLGDIPAALHALGDAQTDSSEYQVLLKKALAELEALLTQKDFAALTKRAGDYTAAVAEPRLLYLEALGREGQGQREAAAELCGRALAIRPADEASHFTAGDWLQDRGRYDWAEAEWRTILRIPPANEIYDVNAWLRLEQVHTHRGEFAAAAEALQTAWDMYQAQRKAGQGGVLVGADDKQIEQRIQWLRAKAAAENRDLTLHIAVRVKDDKAKELRQALGEVAGAVTMNVQPHGLRIFDVAPATVRYDTVKQQLQMTLNGSPCSDPVPLKLEGPTARLAVHTLDCTYVFELDVAAGGDGKQLQRFEKDYEVQLRPGKELRECQDVQVKINGEAADWTELVTGKHYDFLPGEMAVEVEGNHPQAGRKTVKLKMRMKEPAVYSTGAEQNAP